MSKDTILLKDEMTGITYYTRGTKKGAISFYFRANGKTHRFSSGKRDLKEAVAVANEAKRNAERGKPAQSITFAKAGKMYLEYKSARVKPKTLNDYQRNVDFAAEFFGKKDLKDINNKALDALVDYRRNYYELNPEKATFTYKRNGKTIEGRKHDDNISHRTINFLANVVVAVMKYAHERHGYIESSDIPKWHQLKENKRDDFIDEKDMLKMRDYYLSRKNFFYANLIPFIFYSGVRPMSEVNRILWSDIDMEKRCIYVRNRKSKNRVKNTAVPMHDRLKDIIIQMRELTYNGDDSQNVFVRKNGIVVKDIKKSFKSALLKCKLDPTYTPYHLRHGYATFALTKLKLPIERVAIIMGHVDFKMVNEVYGHLREEGLINENDLAYSEALEAGRISQWVPDRNIEEFME